MKLINSKKPNSGPTPVSILVYRNDLKSQRGNGLPKVGLLRRKIFRTWKRVSVEPAPAGIKDSMFYAPLHETAERATPTEFVCVNPDLSPDLVRQTDNFDISFIGMSVSPHDAFMNNNELLLYSLTKDANADADADRGDVGFVLDKHARAAASPIGSPPLLGATKRRSMKSLYYTGPTGFAPAATDIPCIHYDPVVDGHDVGTEPDAFVSIPDSKSLYLQSNCEKARQKPLKRVSIRFSVMELDKVSDTQIRAISGLGDVGQAIGQGSVGVPYFELISGAFEIASLLGKKGLQKYSRPDHVISKDVEFRLAPSRHDAHPASSGEETEHDPRGPFLRYGYYFFLSSPVDAKLYAQTGSSQDQVPLLLKREGFDPKLAHKNEKPYFPLTGVSYVVVKVSRGNKDVCPVDRANKLKEHRKRLDSMLQMSTIMEMISNIENKAGMRGTRRGKGHRQRKSARGTKMH